MPLASISSISGTQAYIRLRYTLAALSSAEDATDALAKGLQGFSSDSTPDVAMSDLFTGTRQAQEALRCSASIVGAYRPIDKDDQLTRESLIVAFNQEANAVADLQAHTKEKLLRKPEANTQAIQVKDAERITAMNALQQEAAESLLQIVSLQLLISVDTSKPEAKDTKMTILPCKEYADLRVRSVELSKRQKSAYVDASSLFVSFFDGHMCRA